MTARAIRGIARRNGVALPQERARQQRQHLLRDADWLRNERANGATVGELAQRLRLTATELRAVLDEHGIPSEDQSANAHDDTIKQLLADGWSYRAVARHIELSPATVRHRAAILGVRSRFRARRVPELHDRAWLVEMYEVRQLSIAEIARQLGSHAPPVRAALVRHGLEIRPVVRYDYAAIVELLSVGRSVSDVASTVGCSTETVRRVADRNGIVRTPAPTIRPPDPAELRSTYQQHGTVLAVAKRYGVSHGTAERWLANVGVFQRRQPRISKGVLRRAIRTHGSTARVARSLGVDPQVVTIERVRHGL